MTPRIAALCLSLLCAGCAAAPLGHVVSVPPGKTAEQAKADNQVCEDKADLRPKAGESVPEKPSYQRAVSWLVPDQGILSSDEHAREIQRAVWLSCMREAGYGVLPPGSDE